MIKLEDELKEDFILYAKEVNEDRAFPDARDGLKPSQRACLYAMYMNKFTSNKPHVKSAKVDGEVIGKLHPHGSEYSTIVRMSQDWINNIPEIDFHGSNGSMIGGPEAAASRYTECRLAKASEDGFFTNIEQDTVDYIPNYSEDLYWPKVFPAIFPRLFVNGSQGIGYTIAQEWEPGNLKEFYEKIKDYLYNNIISFNNIYPDYPTGGIIINKKDLYKIYETGKGSIILRGRTEIFKKIIKITELPYQVYAEDFIQKVKDLTNAKKLDIKDIYNKSDNNGLLIEIICEGDPNKELKKLYKLTDLQINLNANQVALVNGVPKLLNLEEYIKIYTDFNLECIKKEYTHELNISKARLEIVEGLLKALKDINNIIEIIKSSKSTDSARKKLMEQFTENQANAILEMKLNKLANLEQKSLKDEKLKLDYKISQAEDLINNKNNQINEFMVRLKDFTDKYGRDRKTEVINIEKEVEIKEDLPEEEYFISLNNNYIKRIKYNNKFEEDINFIKVKEKDKFILISESGKMYRLPVNKIKEYGINSLGENTEDLLNDKIIFIYTGTENKEFIIMFTDDHRVKKMKYDEIKNLTKNVGAPIIKLKDNKLINCVLMNEEDCLAGIDVHSLNIKNRGAAADKYNKLKENI